MIITARPNYPASRISYYADRVLKDVGLKEPPILVEPILEYFGIDLHLINPRDEIELEKEKGIKIQVPSFLYLGDNKPRIFVREEEQSTRQRLSVFHECGHFDIPWHMGKSYLCDDLGLDVDSLKDGEKEAFEYAAGLIFPSKAFYDDIHSLAPGLEAIGALAKRYHASFEATAINYVKYHPSPCAVAYLNADPKYPNSEFPFNVKYWIKSNRFHRYCKKGQGVRMHPLIASCFGSKIRTTGNIPATIFGSSKKHDYLAELKPYGSEQVFVFLTTPDMQEALFRRTGIHG